MPRHVCAFGICAVIVHSCTSLVCSRGGLPESRSAGHRKSLIVNQERFPVVFREWYVSRNIAIWTAERRVRSVHEPLRRRARIGGRLEKICSQRVNVDCLALKMPRSRVPMTRTRQPCRRPTNAGRSRCRTTAGGMIGASHVYSNAR